MPICWDFLLLTMQPQSKFVVFVDGEHKTNFMFDKKNVMVPIACRIGMANQMKQLLRIQKIRLKIHLARGMILLLVKKKH